MHYAARYSVHVTFPRDLHNLQYLPTRCLHAVLCIGTRSFSGAQLFEQSKVWTDKHFQLDTRSKTSRHQT